jgi:hypothetical protein
MKIQIKIPSLCNFMAGIFQTALERNVVFISRSSVYRGPMFLTSYHLRIHNETNPLSDIHILLVSSGQRISSIKAKAH